MPPRHGKSQFVSHFFPAWYLGTFPDRRVILASYEADFAASWGRKVRDVLSVHGPTCFGVSIRADSSAADRWDIEGEPGGMSTAGVGGPLTGKGADLLVVDDPIKNAEEANSATVRNKHKDWWRSTAYTRLEPNGAAIVMATRWHEDDLSGWLIEEMRGGGDRWDVLNLPAIAEDNDPLGRLPGAALWPARYPVSVLRDIERTLGGYWFSALYQGRPAPPTGGMFRREWFGIVEASPGYDPSITRVRFWDLASTLDGDYTCGVRMARTGDGTFHVEDVVRGRWTPHDRDSVMLQTAHQDGRGVPIWVEQEPGSSGVTVIASLVRLLAGFAIRGERSTGDKSSRALPFAAQCEAGNVRLRSAAWNRDFLDELGMFPHAKHDDAVDASSGAFNKLALAPDHTLGVSEDPFADVRF